MIEGNQPGTQFNNIPNSIYWAIVTMTTVGYGDITPVTPVGRFLSAIVMLIGYTIIAVPTGIVSATMVGEQRKKIGWNVRIATGRDMKRKLNIANIAVRNWIRKKQGNDNFVYLPPIDRSM